MLDKFKSRKLAIEDEIKAIENLMNHKENKTNTDMLDKTKNKFYVEDKTIYAGNDTSLNRSRGKITSYKYN